AHARGGEAELQGRHLRHARPVPRLSGDAGRVHGADQVARRPHPVKLSAQVALVTVAGRGIGRPVAMAFALEVARVGPVARSGRGLSGRRRDREAAGRAAVAVPTDVRQEPGVAALVSRALADSGRIDCLVTAAGVATFSPVADIKTEEWDQLMA